MAHGGGLHGQRRRRVGGEGGVGGGGRGGGGGVGGGGGGGGRAGGGGSVWVREFASRIFFNDTAHTQIYTLALHFPLPIFLKKPAPPLLSHIYPSGRLLF